MYILVGTMILIIFVYKSLDDRNRTISIKTKLVIGMSLASLTMLITGIVEIIRQNDCPKSLVLDECIHCLQFIFNF